MSSDLTTAAWEPDGTGVHHGQPGGNIVRYRNRLAPAARISLDVFVCDADDGGFAIVVAPSFIVYTDAAAAAAGSPDWRASHAFEDTAPLPGSYTAEQEQDADQAAHDLVTALAASDPAALARLGTDLIALIFSWDGQPPPEPYG
jgi:hypothetical protein